MRISRQLFEPVRALNAAMGAVGERKLDTRLEVRSTDELGQLAGRFNRMVERLRAHLEESVLRRRRELSDAQIRMMQAQLNPHFLYNTLDTVKWMGKINKVPEVATVAADLADILRSSISGGEFVTLGEELTTLDRYVEIQSIRFPGKFALVKDVEALALDVLVPKLMLQPIVENSIIHGFADSGGSIVVAARLADEELIITVRDDGCGMSEESLRRFREGGADGGRHLGLRQCGRHSPPALRAGARPALPAGGGARHLRDDKPARREKGGERMLKVVVIEDEELVRRGIVMAVDWASVDCKVVGEASNGEAGLEEIRRLRPDIVVTDIRMPRMDGLEMLRRLREEGCGVSVILLTAYSDFSYAQAALKLGAVDYLLKPFHDGELEAAVQRIAERGRVRTKPGDFAEISSKNRYVTGAVDYINANYGDPELASLGRGQERGHQRGPPQPPLQKRDWLHPHRLHHRLPDAHGNAPAAGPALPRKRGRRARWLPRYRLLQQHL